MKTILHSIDTTGPGGAETVFIELATRLPADKYRSVVVIRGKGWVYEELCRRGITPVLLDTRGSFNLRYLMGLRKIIRDEGVDLIQAHLLGTSVYCSLAGLLTTINNRDCEAAKRQNCDGNNDQRDQDFHQRESSRRRTLK